MFEEYPELVTVNEMIKMLRIGRNKAYEIVNSGEVQSFGKPHKIIKASVIEYVFRQAA